MLTNEKRIAPMESSLGNPLKAILINFAIGIEDFGVELLVFIHVAVRFLYKYT